MPVRGDRRASEAWSRMRLILASRSPQRRAILEQLGIEFDVVVPEVQELEQGPPEEIALENAWRKASAVASSAPGRRVLGVDTVVALGRELFGKPADRDAAERGLRALSGREHRVISAICLVDSGGGPQRSTAAVSAVRFRRLDDATIDWYLDTGEWRERAGGYAIQGRGAALVARLEGEYLGVVGLPVAALLELAPDLLLQQPA
jgi:septum formation protein